MKKFLILVLAGLLLISMVACSGSKDDGKATDGPKTEEKKLVVYSPDSDQTLALVIPQFEEKYDIKVELISASTGECLTRVQNEAANPYADILMGGLDWGYYLQYPDLFEDYISVNDASFPESARNDIGSITYYDTNVNVLIANTDILDDLGLDVTSYKDLLQPELKGKIISADPASSSSAWRQLTNMLLVNGGYDSDEAWEFVTELIKQLDGVISSSSSAVYKTVVDGEYAVGITYEDPVAELISNGAENIKIVYCTEGTTTNNTGTAIVKNAPHMENAKLFIDYLTSDEVQGRYAASTARAANRNLETTNEFVKPWEEMITVDEDVKYVAEHKEDILERWTDLWAELN